jgi:hypothetical protein
MKRVVRMISEQQLKELCLLYKRQCNRAQESGHYNYAMYCHRKYRGYREQLTRDWERLAVCV